MGLPLHSLGAMPERDFARLMQHASEQGTPWGRIEAALTRIAWLLGSQIPGASREFVDYVPRPRPMGDTPPPAAEPTDPPLPADFKPVNLRKRLPT
jgi:hypothetical protein